MKNENYTNIEKNLANVRTNMLEYTNKIGLFSKDITLVAVSKLFGIEKVIEAMKFGQVDFGESRAQELLEKKELVTADVNWHFIGHLQTNKVKYMLDNIALLHSLDRLKLAKEINRQCELSDKTLDALLQVNISKESTKSGIFEEDIFEFIEEISRLPYVKVKGLMTIAPFTDNEMDVRKTFTGLRKLFDKLVNQDLPNNIEMKYISMGMSNDYKIAIQEGSNMIRVGSGIFGNRMYKKT
jgi:PLP dependent protein